MEEILSRRSFSLYLGYCVSALRAKAHHGQGHSSQLTEPFLAGRPTSLLQLKALRETSAYFPDQQGRKHCRGHWLVEAEPDVRAEDSTPR